MLRKSGQWASPARELSWATRTLACGGPMLRCNLTIEAGTGLPLITITTGTIRSILAVVCVALTTSRHVMTAATAPTQPAPQSATTEGATRLEWLPGPSGLAAAIWTRVMARLPLTASAFSSSWLQPAQAKYFCSRGVQPIVLLHHRHELREPVRHLDGWSPCGWHRCAALVGASTVGTRHCHHQDGVAEHSQSQCDREPSSDLRRHTQHPDS